MVGAPWATPCTPEEAGCPPYRFTVEQYHRINETGVFGGDRTELLEGWVIGAAKQSPPEAAALSLLHDYVGAGLPSGWAVRIRSGVTTADSETEPDLAVVRGPGHRYLHAHPYPREVALVIEVAQGTVEADRAVKGRVYARAGIPVYWIVNLRDRQIEVYTQPNGGRLPGYAERQDYRGEERLELVIGGEKVGEVTVQELLPFASAGAPLHP
jgi:Uma2 family endonuclease